MAISRTGGQERSYAKGVLRERDLAYFLHSQVRVVEFDAGEAVDLQVDQARSDDGQIRCFDRRLNSADDSILDFHGDALERVISAGNDRRHKGETRLQQIAIIA